MKTISEFIEELKQRGDEQGFITYDEINQLLPDNPMCYSPVSPPAGS